MNQNTIQSEDKFEIDLIEIGRIIISRIWKIIICAVLAAVATYFFASYLVIPMYESTTKIYVINRQNDNSLTYSDLQSGTQLTKDYQALVTSRPVLEEIKLDLNLKYTDEELEKMITVKVPLDTRIVSMTVENEDPYMARAIADRLRISASKHIANVMNTEAVNVVEEANLPTKPASPKIIKDTILGGVVGAILAAIIILIVNMMDDTIKTPDDIEKYLHVSVLGSIPYLNEESISKKKKSKNSHSHTVKMKKEDN